MSGLNVHVCYCGPKKQRGCYPPTSLPHVQLSRAKARTHLPNFRSFDPAELQFGLSKDLLAELEWQVQRQTICNIVIFR